MPRGDRTGPMGMGPRTGRAAGYCSGYPMPGFANPYVPGFGRFGRGMGWGRGRGMGWGRWASAGYAPYPGVPAYTPYGGAPYYGPAPVPSATPEQEMDFLKSQAEYLENELKAVQERLDQIQSEKPAK